MLASSDFGLETMDVTLDQSGRAVSQALDDIHLTDSNYAKEISLPDKQTGA